MATPYSNQRSLISSFSKNMLWKMAIIHSGLFVSLSIFRTDCQPERGIQHPKVFSCQSCFLDLRGLILITNSSANTFKSEDFKDVSKNAEDNISRLYKVIEKRGSYITY
ncbi:hypothetical protein CEXT_485451 [Caerostris extrusa]|uniref:Uncharacterized protein n=1 Tax=Caerostris extrusa TaxID=172846 RepID=A0AAV4Y3M1_CAEEX|nr:hypothetical protein CEXT_485451 [Caerostris extrusa]